MDERTDDLNAYRDPEDPIIMRPSPEAMSPEVDAAGIDTGYSVSAVVPPEPADEALEPGATADDALAADDETDAVIDDIDQTRSEMSQTIDAIQARLAPDRLKEQAKEVVHDATIGKVENVVNDMQVSARGMGDTILETIRQIRCRRPWSASAWAGCS